MAAQPQQEQESAGLDVGKQRFLKPHEQEEPWLGFHCILAKVCLHWGDLTCSGACFARFDNLRFKGTDRLGRHNPAVHRPAPVAPVALVVHRPALAARLTAEAGAASPGLRNPLSRAPRTGFRRLAIRLWPSAGLDFPHLESGFRSPPGRESRPA